MKRRMTGSWKQYREAVAEAFTRNMHNPAVHWTPAKGFFATPDARLISMDDDEMEIGDAHYSANTGDQSLSGSRSEYRMVRLAQRMVLSGLADNFGSAFCEVASAHDDPDQYSVYDPIRELHERITAAEEAR